MGPATGALADGLATVCVALAARGALTVSWALLDRLTAAIAASRTVLPLSITGERLVIDAAYRVLLPALGAGAESGFERLVFTAFPGAVPFPGARPHPHVEDMEGLVARKAEKRMLVPTEAMVAQGMLLLQALEHSQLVAVTGMAAWSAPPPPPAHVLQCQSTTTPVTIIFGTAIFVNTVTLYRASRLGTAARSVCGKMGKEGPEHAPEICFCPFGFPDHQVFGGGVVEGVCNGEGGEGGAGTLSDRPGGLQRRARSGPHQ